MDLLIHLMDQLLSESLADIHEQGSIERRSFDIGTVAQKILKIHVLSNLPNGFSNPVKDN